MERETSAEKTQTLGSFNVSFRAYISVYVRVSLLLDGLCLTSPKEMLIPVGCKLHSLNWKRDFIKLGRRVKTERGDKAACPHSSGGKKTGPAMVAVVMRGIRALLT